MRPDELRDTGAVLGTVLSEVAGTAREVHRAVARRVFGALGPLAVPVAPIHDAVAATAYGCAALGAEHVPALAGRLAGARRAPVTDAWADRPRGHAVTSAVCGLIGDELADDRPALARPMRLRTETGDLRRRPANVAHDARRTGGVTPRIVVFAHGLCETDRFWSYAAERNCGDPRTTFGSLLAARGWTALYVHYNTGKHISDNGAELALPLDQLITRWPVAPERIALVGHSMGGLVLRAAAQQAHEAGLGWARLLSDVVGLGTPHLGAPLERWVIAGTHLLARLPETKPFADLLNRRAGGIKDLRHGAVAAGDWTGFDPDERVDRCAPATLLPGVTYSMVSATLSARPHGVLAHDLLVEHVSAHGTGRPGAARRIAFGTDRLVHLGRRHHFDLLNDPEVYAALEEWLAARPPRPRHGSAERPRRSVSATSRNLASARMTET